MPWGTAPWVSVSHHNFWNDLPFPSTKQVPPTATSSIYKARVPRQEKKSFLKRFYFLKFEIRKDESCHPLHLSLPRSKQAVFAGTALNAAWVFSIGHRQRFLCSDIILKNRQKRLAWLFATSQRWAMNNTGKGDRSNERFCVQNVLSAQSSLCPIGTFKHSEKLSHKPNSYLNLSSDVAPAHGWVWKTLTGIGVWETSRLSRGFFYFLRHSTWIHNALSQNKEN